MGKPRRPSNSKDFSSSTNYGRQFLALTGDWSREAKLVWHRIWGTVVSNHTAASVANVVYCRTKTAQLQLSSFILAFTYNRPHREVGSR